MKATGIVRRIDDLGRVVIPKEIRRTLRIREGDPLEIYTEKDGEVIFKKYSPMGDLTDFAGQICESIGKNTGHIAAVCDRDAMIAAYGVQRRELMDKHCSQELEQLMESRKFYRYQPGQAKLHPTDSSERYYLGVSAPILSEGDLMRDAAARRAGRAARRRRTEARADRRRFPGAADGKLMHQKAYAFLTDKIARRLQHITGGRFLCSVLRSGEQEHCSKREVEQQQRGKKTAHARGNHAHRFLLAQMPAEIDQRGEVRKQQHTGKPERHITLLLPARARRRRGLPRRRWQGSFEDFPSDARGRPLRLPFPARRSFFRWCARRQKLCRPGRR